MKGIDHLKDIGVDRRMSLLRMWIREDPVAGHFEHGNEPSGSVKDWGVITNWTTFNKTDSATLSCLDLLLSITCCHHGTSQYSLIITKCLFRSQIYIIPMFTPGLHTDFQPQHLDAFVCIPYESWYFSLCEFLNSSLCSTFLRPSIPISTLSYVLVYLPKFSFSANITGLAYFV
jgi:hypothetical protein